jgi:hypothetical protein
MPASHHQHPGQAEPRAHGQTHPERFEIDLNSASEEELADLPMVGAERAHRLIEHRPFESWEDVERDRVSISGWSMTCAQAEPRLGAIDFDPFLGAPSGKRWVGFGQIRGRGPSSSTPASGGQSGSQTPAFCAAFHGARTRLLAGQQPRFPGRLTKRTGAGRLG